MAMEIKTQYNEFIEIFYINQNLVFALKTGFNSHLSLSDRKIGKIAVFALKTGKIAQFDLIN